MLATGTIRKFGCTRDRAEPDVDVTSRQHRWERIREFGHVVAQGCRIVSVGVVVAVEVGNVVVVEHPRSQRTVVGVDVVVVAACVVVVVRNVVVGVVVAEHERFDDVVVVLVVGRRHNLGGHLCWWFRRQGLVERR